MRSGASIESNQQHVERHIEEGWDQDMCTTRVCFIRLWSEPHQIVCFNSLQKSRDITNFISRPKVLDINFTARLGSWKKVYTQ